jgi:hypothetical protein
MIHGETVPNFPAKYLLREILRRKRCRAGEAWQQRPATNCLAVEGYR